MTNDVVIKVENLWKEYRLGVVNHGTLKRDLQSWWARVRGHDDPNTRIDVNAAGRQSPTAPEAADRFWALRDVSFDVRQGEVLGIIGRNGAGKSTLLKILSRVTTPTKGEVKIRGRVASLLEVGTGFHPELTGRENIFLNGAILGMSKAEIRAKLDEIVDFSGVEKFIDTPVKRYSSGMYVRLAFAVAAHLDPEILIIDEVLAVGDAEFQKKCLGKMGEVAKGGRTVLFVSHNMGAVRNLCPHSIVLASGEVFFTGESQEAISSYMQEKQPEKDFRRKTISTGNPFVCAGRIEGVSWCPVDKRSSLTLSLDIDAPVQRKVNIDLKIKEANGGPVFYATTSALDSDEILLLHQGENRVCLTFDITGLAVGNYSVSVDIQTPWVEYQDRLENCLVFTVAQEDWHLTTHPLRQSWQVGVIYKKINIVAVGGSLEHHANLGEDADAL